VAVLDDGWARTNLQPSRGKCSTERAEKQAGEALVGILAEAIQAVNGKQAKAGSTGLLTFPHRGSRAWGSALSH